MQGFLGMPLVRNAVPCPSKVCDASKFMKYFHPQDHPSAEILITLWRVHYKETTNRMKLWQKVSWSSKKKLTFTDGLFCKSTRGR